MDALRPVLPRRFRQAAERAPRVVTRRLHVRSWGGFTRVDDADAGEKGSAAYVIEHPSNGALQVDPRTRTALHVGREQLPSVVHAPSLERVKVEWSLRAEDGALVLSARGDVALDVLIRSELRRDVPPGAARVALAVCLPGIDALAGAGAPLDKIVSAGVPRELETWTVTPDGKRGARLATHKVVDLAMRTFEASLFDVPHGYVDPRHVETRGDTGEPGEPEEENPARRPAPPPRQANPVSGRGAPLAAGRARPAARRFASTIGTYLPPGGVPAVPTEPQIPECAPSTVHASAAFELRQNLLDLIEELVNTIGPRLRVATGARIAPGDPDDTRVRVTVPWLDDLAAFTAMPNNGLFCLLRDPPTLEDPVAGEGLLDRAAVGLATDLLSANPPLPLGGTDDPIALDAAVAAEIAGLPAPPDLAPRGRFDALSPESQVAVREAVLAARLATWRSEFNGNFGDHPLPAADFELLRARLQLQALRIRFEPFTTLRTLEITADDANEPRVALELSLDQVRGDVDVDVRTGDLFWWTAAGVLVAAGIVGPLAVTGLVLVLVGLGPVGWLALMLMLSQAPVMVVAGGAMLVAAVAALLWTASSVRVRLDGAVIRTQLSPQRTVDDDGLFLAPGGLQLEGTLSITTIAPVPDPMGPVFDALGAIVLAAFDREVRREIQANLEARIGAAIRGLPHFRLLPPATSELVVPVAQVAPPSVFPPGVDVTGSVSATLPRANLLGDASNGVASRLLSSGAFARLEYLPAGLAPFLTQVDPDLREALTAYMEETPAGPTSPRFGYALSQNLLNGISFAQWITGRFVHEYNEPQRNRVLAAILTACPDCPPEWSEPHAHVWAAAAPHLLVTPRASDEDARRPYLLVRFPDVRLCVSGVAGKPSAVEFAFGVEALAHVAFGSAGTGGANSLLRFGGNFLDVRFDDRDDFLAVVPTTTQGVTPVGPGFAPIAALDAAARAALLGALQEELRAAAVLLLGRRHIGGLRFVPRSTRFDQQLYDGLFTATFRPRRASILVTFHLSALAAVKFPHRDENDVRHEPGLPLAQMTCQEGTALREQIGEQG